MMSTHVNEVAGSGLSVELVVDDVIDIAIARKTGAPGKGARHIGDLEPAFQIGRRPVRAPVDMQQRSTHRMRQQPGEGRRVSGEAASGLGVDRTVPFEDARLVTVTEEGHHGNGDRHRDAVRTPVFDDPVDEYIGGDIGPQLSEAAPLVRLSSQSPGGGVDAREGAVREIGRQLHREVSHTVDVVVDPDASGLRGRLDSFGQGDRMDTLTQDPGPHPEPPRREICDVGESVVVPRSRFRFVGKRPDEICCGACVERVQVAL